VDVFSLVSIRSTNNYGIGHNMKWYSIPAGILYFSERGDQVLT